MKDLVFRKKRDFELSEYDYLIVESNSWSTTIPMINLVLNFSGKNYYHIAYPSAGSNFYHGRYICFEGDYIRNRVFGNGYGGNLFNEMTKIIGVKLVKKLDINVYKRIN